MYRPWMNRKFGIELEMNEQRTRVGGNGYEFGIELEMNEQRTRVGGNGYESLDLATVTDAVTRTTGRTFPVRTRGYGHSDGSMWDIKTDSSCGIEVASPAMTLDETGNNAELKNVMNNIKALKPRVDARCGVHVHVDVSDFTWRDVRNLLVMWSRYEAFMFSLTPPSRRTNTYCLPLRRSTYTQTSDSRNWQNISRALEATTERSFRQFASQPGKYASLNLEPWWTNGRVEFRLHSGTVEYETKARWWIMLLLSFVQRVKNRNLGLIVTGFWTNKPVSIPHFGKQVGLAASEKCSEIAPESTQLLMWIRARQAQIAALTPAAPTLATRVRATTGVASW